MNNFLSKKEKSSIKNVLVIQTAFIGDVILSTTIFKGIKKILPNVNIDVITIPQTSNLLISNPHIRNVIEFDKREIKNRAKSFFSVVRKIKKNKYDLAISIQSSFTSSLLMLLGKIQLRIGYPRQRLVTHSPILEKGLHIRKRVLKLLEPIEKNGFDTDTELFWSENEEIKIEEILKNSNSNKLIAVAPGSAQFTKQWPIESFGKTIKKIEELDVGVIFIGGKEDKALCSEIIKKYNLSSINLAGNLSLLESAALINKVNLVLSNDSAPLHIANAVDTKVIALFGPTVKEFGCYPYRLEDKILEVDLECRPCSKHGGDKCPDGHFKCMIDLSHELVIKEIKQKLQL